MSSENMSGLRKQTLANANMLLTPDVAATRPLDDDASTTKPENSGDPAGLDVIVFGKRPEFIAAITQEGELVIEGETGGTPEAAMRKLLTTTCELLGEYLPKVGEHHRNVAGGGVYKVDAISKAWTKAV